MSDWGKLVSNLVEKMPWVVLMALAIFVLVPDALVPDFALAFRTEWRAVALWSLLIMGPITVVWFYDRWQTKQTKQQEEVLAAEAIWGKFTRLHPKVQMFLIRLFFSGYMSETVRLKDPIVAMLIDQGFLAVTNGGMVSADNSGELVVNVMISRPMLDFMNKYSEEFRKQADRIMSSGQGAENRDR